MPAGRFISFEGGEGSGKSTQIQALAETLRAHGKDVHVTREPGGEEQAEQIRTLLVTGDAGRWDAMAETLLFLAARVQHAVRIIQPKLAQGCWVLSDRSLDSTRVYQGMAKGVGVDVYDQLHTVALEGFMPDLTLVLDIDPEIGLGRSLGRDNTETRFEHMALSFHQQVREGFVTLSKQEPERMAMIDAAQSQQEVSAAIWQEVGARLGPL